jgi:hypothetical protein
MPAQPWRCTAAPATILVARGFMEHLLVLVHLQWINRGRFLVGCPPATEAWCARTLMVIGKSNFGVLALTSPLLRQSQFYEPCENIEKSPAAALARKKLTSSAPAGRFLVLAGFNPL